MADETPSQTSSPLLLRPAEERHLPAINAIYNEQILHGTATWENEPWSEQRRREWLTAHDEHYPVFVAVEEDASGGVIAGFGYLSAYRPRIGYRYTREDSVYVHPDHARRGVGTVLLRAVEAEAAGKGVQVLRLRASLNSVRFYEACGYETVRKVKRELPFSEAMECMEMEKRVS